MKPEILVQATENRGINGRAIDGNFKTGTLIELTLQQVKLLGFTELSFHRTKSAVNKNKKKWGQIQIIGAGKHGSMTWARAEQNASNSIIYGDKRLKKGFNQFINRKSSNIIAIGSEPNKKIRMALAQRVNNMDNQAIIEFPKVV